MVEKLQRGNKIHTFVCVNDKQNPNKPDCAQHISQDQFNELKVWNKLNHYANNLLTKTACLGVCNPDGGVVAVYPSKNFYKGIKDIEEIKKIIETELKEFNN
jgi:(2Fe-2S) ferredoxin